MMQPQRRALANGRWHLQHGPIDLIISADGKKSAVEESHAACWRAFQTILIELVEELPQLREASRPGAKAERFRFPTARRMARATAPFSAQFITPMAAVAGAVADQLIACFDHAGIRRAAINNGGDIALMLQADQQFEIAIADDCADDCADDGADPVQCNARHLHIAFDQPVRGIATSGWRGRSFSRGIADRVTVLSSNAALADAAATMIANHVDVDHPRIVRRPASELKDDSDLGDRLVTCEVPALARISIEQALGAGARYAAGLLSQHLIAGCVLHLQGIEVLLGSPACHMPLLKEAA